MNKLCNKSYSIGWIEYSYAVNSNLQEHEAKKYLSLCRQLNYLPSEEISWYIQNEHQTVFQNHLKNLKNEK